MKNEFISQLRQDFPALQTEPLENLVSENLISPYEVELPSSLQGRIQNIVASVFALREKKAYQDFYRQPLESLGLQDPGNNSILMSYDFHIDAEGQPKLIEINTNASFLLLGYEMYRAKKIPPPISNFSLEEIRAMILNELHLQGKKIPCPRVSIVDENPGQQKLYVEFLAYDALFKSFGWDSRIQDYREVSKDRWPDFIYNRYTDFLLNDPSSADLREKFLSREVCLSPHPWEYFLLADKERLIDWSQPGFLEGMGLEKTQLETIRKMLPASHVLSTENKTEMWAQRKRYFFKPMRSFGSKMSYRGSSISHKHFEEFEADGMMAQEYVPPAEKTFATPEGPQSFKFDLRCYAYQGRLQLIVARLYQGQVTNLRTPGGGFACVKWI